MLTPRVITRLAGAPFQVKLVVYLYTGNYIFPSDIFTSVFQCSYTFFFVLIAPHLCYDVMEQE